MIVNAIIGSIAASRNDGPSNLLGATYLNGFRDDVSIYQEDINLATDATGKTFLIGAIGQLDMNFGQVTFDGVVADPVSSFKPDDFDIAGFWTVDGITGSGLKTLIINTNGTGTAYRMTFVIYEITDFTRGVNEIQVNFNDWSSGATTQNQAFTIDVPADSFAMAMGSTIGVNSITSDLTTEDLPDAVIEGTFRSHAFSDNALGPGIISHQVLDSGSVRTIGSLIGISKTVITQAVQTVAGQDGMLHSPSSISWQDSNFTQLALNPGDVVGGVSDNSPYRNSLVQGVSSRYATLSQDYPRSWEFDGVEDRLAGFTNPNETGTLFVRFKHDPAAVGTTEVMLGAINAGTERCWLSATNGILSAGIADVGSNVFQDPTGADLKSHNIWYTAAVTWDGRDVKLYLDGAEINTTTRSGDVEIPTNRAVYLGARNNDGTGDLFFAGKISHALSSQIALTPTEIQLVHDEWTPNYAWGYNALRKANSATIEDELGDTPTTFTLVGDPTVTSGAINFDGNDEIEFPEADAYLGDRDFILQARFRATDTTPLQGIASLYDSEFAQNRSWLLRLNGDDLEFFSSTNGTSATLELSTTGNAIANNTWYDVEVRRVDTLLEMFVDGVSVDTSTLAGGFTFFQTTSALGRIGGYGFATDRTITGDIEHFSLRFIDGADEPEGTQEPNIAAIGNLNRATFYRQGGSGVQIGNLNTAVFYRQGGSGVQIGNLNTAVFYRN